MPDFSRMWRPGRLGSRAVRAAVISLAATAAMAGTSLSVAAAAVSRPPHSAAATAGHSGFAPGQLWSGTKWTVEPTPSPSGAKYTFLQGVACTSGRNCWTAGEWGSPTGPRALIEHWNGSAWSITP